MWCRKYRQSLRRKVRPRSLELVRPKRTMINLPLHDELEWSGLPVGSVGEHNRRLEHI